MSLNNLLIKDISEWKNNSILKKNLSLVLKLDEEFGWNFPQKIKHNEKLLFLLNSENMILSLCHITIKDLILEFSFSYTPTNCRRKGYNKYLRKVIIENYKKKGIKIFTSTPYPGAHSIPLLKSIGFLKESNQYILNV